MQNNTAAIVADGIRKFVRLQALPIKTESQIKWSADPTDLIEALLTTKQCFADTERMVAGQMYQTSQYSHTEDVKYAMEEILLIGEDEHESALLRRKNLSMYHLVVEPVIDMFASVDHYGSLAQVNDIIDMIIKIISSSNDYGHADDAIVAQHQIRSMVKQRSEARLAQKLARKRVDRKKKVVLDLPDEE